MYYSAETKKNLIESLEQINRGLSVDVKSQKPPILYYNEHKYEFNKKEIDLIFDKKIYKAIINSKAFQRLKNIHFLGSIDYVVDPDGPKPNKRHTRYQHSLGVARLALQYADEMCLSEEEEILCVISGLLHDIGHAPLSHSLESVFKKQFGLSHHKSGELIIKGEVPIGKDLHKILCDFGINPFEVLSIINGTGLKPFREIFSYAINIDTIEGISRSSTYIYGNNIFFTPSQILTALFNYNEDSTIILDKFWELKGEIYLKLINSRLGVISDFICQNYMSNNVSTFKKSYYFGTEDELQKEHLMLFQDLSSIKNKKIYNLLPGIEKIDCFQRNFVINENIILNNIDSINKRYTQTKSPFSYEIKERGSDFENRNGSSQHSFEVFRKHN